MDMIMLFNEPGKRIEQNRTSGGRFFTYCLHLLILVFVFPSCNSLIQENAEGLILAINFDEEDTSVFSDDATRELMYSSGIKGNGLNLKGSHFVKALEVVDTSWFSNARDFSISIWVKSAEVISDTTIILSNSDFRKKETGIYGKRRTNEGITFYSYDGAWGWNIGNGSLHYLYEPVASDQPIADNKWHHLAFTYQSSLKEVRLFYNGINKAVIHIGDLDNKNFRSDLPLRIGEDQKVSPPYRSFPGTIDELRVWEKTLSPKDVRNEFEKHLKIQKEPKLKTEVITVLNWNIWHGGTHFSTEKDGFDGIERITELIKKNGADIILMQETYGAGSKISSELGFYYYEAGSTIGAVWGANLSVMSRYPLADAYMVEEQSNYGKNYAFNNGGVKIRLSNEKSVVAFSNWYNGGKPEDLEGALNAWKHLIDNSANIPIIFGGDFNSTSHLDDGIGESGHSKLMESAGFKDSFRQLYPDAKKYPCYTAPRYEDRIDYIYYNGSGLKLMEAGQIIEDFKGKLKNPGYPSDHLGITATFKID